MTHYQIEGESLCMQQIRERVKERAPSLNDEQIRRRVKVYGWRTWTELCKPSLCGRNSPWRRFRAIPYFRDVSRMTGGDA